MSNSSMSSSVRVSQLLDDFFRTFAALLRWETDKSSLKSSETHGKCQKLLIMALRRAFLSTILASVKSNCASFFFLNVSSFNIIVLVES